jgi:AhpC/TSA family/Disulphide bond corrector protein DsbC
VELEQSYASIRAQGLGLAAVSYDSVEVLKSFATRKQITFPMLSDPGSEIIRRYGIFNDTVEKGNIAYGVPFPGTYVLDARGVIVAKYFEDDYKERETVSSILVQQFGISAAGAHVTKQSKQLQVSSSASVDTVATGQHVALVLDIDLKPKMHVYAPGVEHYIPIDWQITESDAAKAEAVKWPQSKTLHLDAIDETVPVYTGSFRIVRDIVFAPDAKLKSLVNEKGEITIHGTLRYQACDDKMCFIPASVPLDWTFHYQPLDRQRFQK